MFRGNPNVIEWRELRDADGLPINVAAMSYTLFDQDGAEVGGQAWPEPMLYVPGSDGNYRGPMDASLDVVAGCSGEYTAHVTAPGYVDVLVPVDVRTRHS